MPPSPQTAKLTSTLHLLIPRLRLLQKKDTASSVVQRRDLANLLDAGRDASARIRVENVIATDIAVEVMEMVELYCELILARANVLDQLAFGEKGVRARNRAREVANARRLQQQQQQQQPPPTETTSKPSSGGLSFPFRLFGGGAAAPQAAKKDETRSISSTATTYLDGRDDGIDNDESKYLDPALDEAAAVIFYAWPRFPHDVRELTILRSLLTDRWGKDFMTLAQDNKLDDVPIPERVAKALRVRPPSQELVESYLREIARAYGVSWGQTIDSDDVVDNDEYDGGEGDDALTQSQDDQQPGGDSKHVGDGMVLSPSTPQRPDIEARRASETAELNRATPPRRLQSGKSPVSVAPPGPRWDNPSPRVKVPGNESGAPIQKDTTPKTTPATAASNTGASKSGGVPELDELTRRFAALKR